MSTVGELVVDYKASNIAVATKKLATANRKRAGDKSGVTLKVYNLPLSLRLVYISDSHSVGLLVGGKGTAGHLN